MCRRGLQGSTPVLAAHPVSDKPDGAVLVGVHRPMPHVVPTGAWDAMRWQDVATTAGWQQSSSVVHCTVEIDVVERRCRYDDLRNYSNERSIYLAKLRDTIEKPWQQWELDQVDSNINSSMSPSQVTCCSHGVSLEGQNLGSEPMQQCLSGSQRNVMWRHPFYDCLVSCAAPCILKVCNVCRRP